MDAVDGWDAEDYLFDYPFDHLFDYLAASRQPPAASRQPPAASRYTLTATGDAPVAVEVDVEEDAVSSLQVKLGSPALVGQSDDAVWFEKQ